MKKTLAFIIFLIFLLLAWLSWDWYKNTVVCCPVVEEEVMVYGPIIFDCATDEPITNEQWPDKKMEILALKREGKNLIIIGPYYDGETESQGLARAEKVKLLFANDLELDIIEVDARPAGDCESTKANLMHGSMYRWVTRNDDIIEELDRTIVFYQYGTAEEVYNANLQTYFNDLATFLKDTNDKVIITGHTDSTSGSEFNLKLGLERANEFKDHLVSLGVDPSRIEVASKGETEPRSSNDTPEGQQQNRRAEIQIIETN